MKAEVDTRQADSGICGIDSKTLADLNRELNGDEENDTTC